MSPILIAVLALSLIVVAKAYDPAGDVLTKVHASLDSLGPARDNVERLLYKFEPDNEYPAGGYTSVGLAAHATGALAVLSIKSIVHVDTQVSAGGYVPSWNPATGKLMVFVSKDPGDAGGADLPLQEVAAAVDLSAEDFYIWIYGARA